MLEKQWECFGRRGLSPRELDVVKLACSTALNEEGMADELGIARGTIKTHLKHIYAKLQIREGNRRMAMFLMFLESVSLEKARKMKKRNTKKKEKEK